MGCCINFYVSLENYFIAVSAFPFRFFDTVLLEINVLEETCGKILINLYIDSRIHWKGISLHFRLIFSSKNVLLSAIKRIGMNCRKSRKFSLVWKREEKFSYCRGFDRKLFYFKLKKLRDGMFENYKYRKTDCKLLKNLIPTFFFFFSK